MADKENVQISSNGIRNSLKKYNSHKSIAEYVWNGFDANATQIIIDIDENELGKISSVVVSDNGHGIDRSLLDLKFKPFFQSEKIYDPNSKHSNVHGKNGVGRLTFFTFASIAEWSTVYSKDGNNYEYTISVDSNELNNYNPGVEKSSIKNTGTVVKFYNIIDKELSINDIKKYLIKEFCWYLELNKDKGYFISLNGEKLNYDNLIVEKEDKSFELNEVNVSFDISFVCWNTRLSEYSKYYIYKFAREGN